MSTGPFTYRTQISREIFKIDQTHNPQRFTSAWRLVIVSKELDEKLGPVSNHLTCPFCHQRSDEFLCSFDTSGGAVISATITAMQSMESPVKHWLTLLGILRKVFSVKSEEKTPKEVEQTRRTLLHLLTLLYLEFQSDFPLLEAVFHAGQERVASLREVHDHIMDFGTMFDVDWGKDYPSGSGFTISKRKCNPWEMDPKKFDNAKGILSKL